MGSCPIAAYRGDVPDDLEIGDVRDDLAFDDSRLTRLNAWFFTKAAEAGNGVTEQHKRQAFAGMQPGVVVELGAGGGANLAYIPRGSRYVAIEPNRRMHPALRRRCLDAGLDATILATGAQAIPLADATVDEVICSLVLCSISDVDTALTEVRRVLRPGGHFRFVEHVADPEPTFRARVQRGIRRPWGWLLQGCDPHKDTLDAVEGAGFDDVVTQRRDFGAFGWPANTGAWGVATR